MEECKCLDDNLSVHIELNKLLYVEHSNTPPDEFIDNNGSGVIEKDVGTTNEFKHIIDDAQHMCTIFNY